MQKAEVVLKILRKKSEQSEEYVFGRLYRNLFNPEFYMLAYNRIHAKEGNMTPGADGKTIDGFNVVLVEKLIGKIGNTDAFIVGAFCGNLRHKGRELGVDLRLAT